MSVDLSPYLLRPKTTPNPAARLVAFPYAGASAVMYHAWAAKLQPDIELVAVQYPGRGRLAGQQPCKSMSELLHSIYPAICSLDETPTFFFGHSMGASVCFEITLLMLDEGRRLPQGLVLSGRGGPDATQIPKGWRDMPDAEFHEQVTALGGMREEVLSSPELLAYTMRLLRADLTVAETCKTPSAPIPVPILAIGGHDDHYVKPESLQLWRRQTTAHFEARVFPGGHFFFQSQLDDVLALVRRNIAQLGTQDI